MISDRTTVSQLKYIRNDVGEGAAGSVRAVVVEAGE
jgi:hypothetical protein